MHIDPSQPSPKPQTLEEAQKVIDLLWSMLCKLDAQVQALQEKSRTNSSKAPSSDIAGRKKAVVARKKSGKKQGGQPARVGTSRELSDSAEVSIQVCPPQTSCECGAAVHQTKLISRHQSIEIPVIKPVVTEYRVYAGQCQGCGKCHQGQLPTGVTHSLVGPGLLALMGTLTGGYRLSKRMVQSLLHDVFGTTLSLDLPSTRK